MLQCILFTGKFFTEVFLLSLLIMINICSTRYSDIPTASCYVRMGNMLAYPVTNHYGWSDSGTGRPSRCGKSATGSAEYYYCSKSSLCCF